MGLPVIGIVGYGHVVPRHFGHLPVAGVPQRYVDQVVASGARPVLLPGPQAVDLLDVVDALVLTGGGDLEAGLSGAAASREVDLQRDAAELDLVRAAAARQVPLLGVCRGLQVLVVAFGGTLRSGLQSAHLLGEGTHPISTLPGSRAQSLLGASTSVNSLHRQAVAEPGTRWHATAWAPDGVVEAVEWSGLTPWPVLGVQWHPELDDPSGPTLFGWLAAAATRRPAPAGC